MAFLLFLTLNLSVPLYLRLKKSPVPFYARGVGFLEDLFIVLELFLLASVSLPLAALIGFLIHTVLLLDSMLYNQMQLKLRFSYLMHLRHAGSFYSSAKELGLKKWVRGSFAILALHSLGYFVVYHPFEVFLLDGVIVLGVGVLAFLLTKRLPKKMSYAIENFFFHLQVFQRKEKQAAVSLKFPLESFHLLDENYPLWRLTKGFKGEKQFDLNITPEEKPHVIVLFLESFSSHALEKAALNFNQLSQEGILFSNFYSNGTFTYRAMLAGLFGIAGGDTAKGLGPYVNVPYAGLPQLMKQAGYSTAFFHNGSLSFDKQREFLKNHFDLLADRSEIEDSPNTSTSWGAHDECLMRYTVNWLEKQQQPAFMTLFTISNHHPWIPPEHYKAPAFEAMNLSHQRFLQTMHYSDHCLGLLIQQLREKNLSKKTVLLIVGDHSQPLGQHHGNFYYSRFLYEENVRVPLLIVADGRVSEPKTIEEIGSHVDLLPTLMDLLHLQGVQHGCGRSLMRQTADSAAMLHNPYSEEFLGCRKGPWKWIENCLTQEGELYDVTVDPLEKNNQAAAFPDIAKALQKTTQDYFHTIYDLHRNQRIIPETNESSPIVAVNFDFSGKMITDEELIQLVSPKVEKLNLRDCLLITDVSVSAVLSKCKGLEELNLQGVTDVTFEFQVSSERLRTLHISEAAITDSNLETLVNGCPNLSIVSLLGKNLTDRGIKALSRCRHLVRLKIVQADNISEEALLGVLRNNPHLGHLVLQGCKNLSDRTLEALQAHPLELLWILDAPQLTDEGIAYLSNLPIRFLTLEGCPLLTDKTIASLKKLNLESAYLNCQGLVHL